LFSCRRRILKIELISTLEDISCHDNKSSHTQLLICV
jgi:hypothetical protein